MATSIFVRNNQKANLILDSAFVMLDLAKPQTAHSLTLRQPQLTAVF